MITEVEDLTVSQVKNIANNLIPAVHKCLCGLPGCNEMTRRRFAPGHDAIMLSLLKDIAKNGDGEKKKYANQALVNGGYKPSVARRATRNGHTRVAA